MFIFQSEHIQAARSQVREMSQHFQAALISYDEGLLSDDKVLAGAIWRRLFNASYVDPIHLEAIVKYIRKTVDDISVFL
jgi:cytochrome b pre-mRNA-processing protein 3